MGSASKGDELVPRLPSAADPRVASWRAFRRARGLNVSKVRETVVRVFLGSQGHVSLADVQALARRLEERVGFVTVYRTMKLLEEARLAERHDFYGEVTRYEARRGQAHHDHMICRACGEIFEFESKELERLQDRIASTCGFLIEMHRHELYGICRDCQAKGGTSANSANGHDEPNGANPI